MGARDTRRAVDATLSFVDPHLATLVAHWQEHARDGRVPDRAAFGLDALHAMGVLPDILLFDAVDGGARFRVRLVGTGLTRLSGRDSTGRFLDELYEPEDYDPMAESMRWTIRERRPLRITGTFALVGKEFIPYEALMAPLANGGTAVEMIIFAILRQARRPPAA